MIERIIAYPGGEGNAWADAREFIVRCRDCHNAAPFDGDEQERQICWLRSAGYIVEPDDFCSYGKRRDG